MKFRSPTETPVHISLLSGHTCLIGKDLVEVEQRFVRQAIADGCLREGEEPAANGPADKTKADLVLDAVRAMVAEAKEEDFNNDGKPDLRKLSKRAGFEVSRDERDTAWQAIADDDADA